MPPGTDFYDLIRNTPVDGAKQLGQKTIDGKKLLGYSIQKEKENKGDKETWQTTFWVDPATKLPVRIETSYRTNIPIKAEKDSLITNIVFDVPLDPDLFSLAPPSDYHDGASDYLVPKSINGKNTEFVFADVQNEVAKTKSVQYAEIRTDRGHDKEFLRETKANVKVLGSTIERRDVTAKAPKLPEGQTCRTG